MDGVIGRGTVLSGRYELTDPRPCDLPGTTEWRATDQILGRPVVVRAFPVAGAGPALDAARRAALVTDPRLVRVLDVGSDEGAGYVIPELVPGPPLALLVGREPLSPDQARAIVGEAAAALEVARRRGVHHLALRPSAVAVSDDGRVLVTGTALDAVLLGRPGGDARTTSRTDATDLVRLVYTALTGHWPGPGETADGLPTAPAVEGAPVPPGDLVAGVPGDLNTLCTVTLGRDDDGPLSPADLVRELEPWGEIRVQPKPRPFFPPVVADPVEPTTVPGQVVRQSVRTAFPPPSTPPPGTPSPAPSSRDAITPPMGVPFAFAAAAGDAPGPGDAAPYDWSAPSPAGTPASPAGAAVDDATAPAPVSPAGPAVTEGSGPASPATGTPAPASPATGGPTSQADHAASSTPSVPVRRPTGAMRTVSLPATSVGSSSPQGAPGGVAPVPPGPAAAPPVTSSGPMPSSGRATGSAFASAAPAGPAGAPGPGPAAHGGPPALPPTGPSQTPPQGPTPFDFGQLDDGPPRRTGMGIAIAIVAVLVVVAIAFAAKALFAGHDVALAPGAATHTGQQSPSGGPTSPQPSATPTATTTTSTAPGVIASITSIDPTGGAGDHQELVGRAFDGDPSTYWMSFTYKRNDFAGFKPALGLQLQLARPATVRTVTLHVNGTGGNVEIRTGDATQPTGGTKLASGPMSPDAVFTLDPVQTTSSLVIWFTQLPTTADGSFRIELTEIQLG